MPYSAVDDSLCGVGSLLEVVVDLGVGGGRVEEGITLGLVVFLPRTLVESHLALEPACHVAVYAHGGAAVLLAEELNGLVKVGKDVVGHHGTAVARKLHLCHVRVERTVHPCQGTIVAEHGKVVPCAEIVGLAHELVVGLGARLAAVAEVVEEEVDVADVGICRECGGITEDELSGQTGVRCGAHHVVGVDVGTGNVATAARTDVVGTDSGFVELCDVVLDFACGDEGACCGENAFGLFVQVEAPCKEQGCCKGYEDMFEFHGWSVRG